MRRYLSVFACGLVLACALALFAPSALARPLAANVVSGVVVNGTHANAVVADQKVTLQRSSGANTQDVATAVTDSAGRFAFAHVAGTVGNTFAVYTQYQGGMFPSAAVALGTTDATSLQLPIYDTTNDDAHLSVKVATLLVRQPRPVNGLIGLGEVISIQNSGTTAFVGTPTGDANKPMRLLRFATPPNASDLSLGLGFDGAQIVTTDKGFGATATVPPGTTEFAFGIDIPYTGTTADVSYKAIYPTARVVVLVSPDMFVNGRDFQAQGIVNSLGSNYQVFTVANTKAGGQVALQLTGLTQAGEKSYLDAHVLTILAAILALLALLALLLYLRRGNLAPALGLAPAIAWQPVDESTRRPVEVDGNTDGERERLLRELLALERSHAVGSVSDSVFRQTDRVLRLRLRELLTDHQSNTQAVDTASEEVTADVTADEAVSARETAREQSSGGRL